MGLPLPLAAHGIPVLWTLSACGPIDSIPLAFLTVAIAPPPGSAIGRPPSPSPCLAAVLRTGLRISGELLNTLEGHSDAVRSVAVSPCGTFIASGSSDRTVRLWNRTTGVHA